MHQANKLRDVQKQSADPAFSLESAMFTPATHDSSRSLFVPVHYEPNYGYPLVVWLHGPGDDERQLLRIMPIVSMRNYVAAAPRGLRLGPADSGAETLGWPQAPDLLPEAEQRVYDSIEAAQRKYHVARQRIFLAGFGAGGTMAFRIAMAHPSHFAGVLSLGGAFPTGRTPFGQLSQARRLPVFLAVCRDSAEYSPAAACGDLRLLHTAGMSIILRQYPCGHQLMPIMLRDMDRWMIEQITSLATRPSESSTGEHV